MAESADLPVAFVALREALGPISHMLAARLADKPPGSRRCADPIEFIQDYLRRMDRHMRRLDDVLNRHIAPAARPDGTETDVSRAVARLEAHVKVVLDDYDRVRRTKAVAEDARGVSLLGGVYRHTLRQIERWINELIATLDDPEAAALKRGLPTTGHVELRFVLTIESPPQLSRLNRWASVRRQRPETAAKKRSMGIVGWTAAAFGVGWLLGGDDCDV